jgi:hypothetical protein
LALFPIVDACKTELLLWRSKCFISIPIVTGSYRLNGLSYNFELLIDRHIKGDQQLDTFMVGGI